MTNRLILLIRFCILLLFDTALLGLIGHQILLVPNPKVPAEGTILCTISNGRSQQASPDSVGCAVHTGFLITTTAIISFSPTIRWDEEHVDLTEPFLLTIPIPHPPA